MPGVRLLPVLKLMKSNFLKIQYLGPLLAIILAGLAGVGVYRFFYGETVIFEKVVNDYGYRISVTCRPDQLFLYYGYVVVKTPSGSEVARSGVTGESYEALNACRNSIAVKDIELIEQKKKARLHFANTWNVGGNAEYIDVPVSFFPR